jgi:hypothetical protein
MLCGVASVLLDARRKRTDPMLSVRMKKMMWAKMLVMKVKPAHPTHRSAVAARMT